MPEIAANITQDDYATHGKAGSGCAPTVRHVVSRAIGREFAAVADVPGAASAGIVLDAFQCAMLDDFSCVRYARYGFPCSVDLELIDLCGVAGWAAIQAKHINDGTTAEKRASRGWRERLRALNVLRREALGAALRMRATTPEGMLAKVALVAILTPGHARMRQVDRLIEGACWDFARMNTAPQSASPITIAA